MSLHYDHVKVAEHCLHSLSDRKGWETTDRSCYILKQKTL